jgi:hypothetical protein
VASAVAGPIRRSKSPSVRIAIAASGTAQLRTNGKKN